MSSGYTHATLADIPVAPDKPASRHEVSKALGIDGYNLNITVLEPAERHPHSGLHYHEAQEEFFYVMTGRCRVETESDSIDLGADEMVVFRPGTAQMIHNPFDSTAKILAIGYPADKHQPAEIVQAAEDLLAERYPEAN